MVLKLKYNLSCVKTNISLGAPIRMHDYERLNSWHTAYESGSHFYENTFTQAFQAYRRSSQPIVETPVCGNWGSDDIKAVEGWCVLSVNNL